MEDVLEVYSRASDARFPQVCLDETCKQLLAQPRPAEAMQPGKAARYDYEYDRRVVCSLFLACDPLAGKRVVQVTAQRPRQDWAWFVRSLLDDHYPQAEKVILVMDNLNTHTIGSLYDTFEPQEAERLRRKLEIHYTPKHASWLNMAEIELSVLARQCLGNAWKHNTRCRSKRTPGNNSAIKNRSPSIGASPRLRLVSSSNGCIRLSNEGGQSTSRGHFSGSRGVTVRSAEGNGERA